MTTYTCPEGHMSSASDYCDVCGTPIAGATASSFGSVASGGSAASGSVSSSAPGSSSVASAGSVLDLGASAAASSGGSASGGSASSAPATRRCPNCSAPGAPDALFCEHCGYDFTTGQLPQPLSPQPLSPPPGRTATATPLDAVGLGSASASSPVVSSAGSSSGGSITDSANVALATDPTDADVNGSAASNTDADANGANSSSSDSSLSSDGSALSDSDASNPASADAVGAVLQPPPSDPAVPHMPASAVTPTQVDWVIEIWIDPDWHAAQDIDDPCPSAGMPTVVPVRSRNLLVGRTSASRNIHPDIDIAADTGVSRRHAQLTGDGNRWWIEDLASANGTYVGAAGDPLPDDPLTPGSRVELKDDDRVYLGAWSRLVLRRASDAERAAAQAGTL